MAQRSRAQADLARLEASGETQLSLIGLVRSAARSARWPRRVRRTTRRTAPSRGRRRGCPGRRHGGRGRRHPPERPAPAHPTSAVLRERRSPGPASAARSSARWSPGTAATSGSAEEEPTTSTSSRSQCSRVEGVAPRCGRWRPRCSTRIGQRAGRRRAVERRRPAAAVGLARSRPSRTMSSAWSPPRAGTSSGRARRRWRPAAPAPTSAADLRGADEVRRATPRRRGRRRSRGRTRAVRRWPGSRGWPPRPGRARSAAAGRAVEPSTTRP